MLVFKCIFCVTIIALAIFATNAWGRQQASEDVVASAKQFDLHNRDELLQSHDNRNLYVVGLWGAILLSIIVVFSGELSKVVNKLSKIASILCLLCLVSGCRKPFEPVKLEMIAATEEGFLIPNNNPDDQGQTKTEEYYKKRLVFSQEVKIPQKWVKLGHETIGYNGHWIDDAVLIRVDRSPITREWTADVNSGTSAKNEAIWVMTSDQVEFSTGWTCTCRIESRDSAVKFLYNYPNGSLATVMDQEIRAKIQSTFGLAVTDLPMNTLRLSATPVIVKTIEDVTNFFDERGVKITNLGITGGFVYKDPKIIAKMVEVFTAEQEKSIAIAKSVAQVELNKTIQLEADAKAKASLTVKEAEAQGIQLVADAKAYEIEKAQENSDTYITLKRLELEHDKLEKWDGKFPTYFMGSGENMNMLLTVPENITKESKEQPK